MNILHISASHEDHLHHAFSHHFKKTCKKMNHEIYSLSPFVDGWITATMDYKFKNEQFKDFYIGKKLFPLSRIASKYDADMVFIENPKFPFDNDLKKIPVVYYHRDLYSKVYCPNADFLGIRFTTTRRARDGRPWGGQPEILEKIHPEIWYNEQVQKFTLFHAISQDEFDELDEYRDLIRYKEGFSYYGSYKSVAEMVGYNSIHEQIYRHHLQFVEFMKKYKLCNEFHEVNEKLENYKKHLFECEATVIIPAWDSWETRRLYEASYCKCVPILFCQNEAARGVFKLQGYVDGKNCIMFENEDELYNIDLSNYNLRQIRNEGYKLVTRFHTYEARVKELFNEIGAPDFPKFKLLNSIKTFINNNINKNINNIISLCEEYKNKYLI